MNTHNGERFLIGFVKSACWNFDTTKLPYGDYIGGSDQEHNDQETCSQTGTYVQNTTLRELPKPAPPSLAIDRPVAIRHWSRSNFY
jgi:hypothetical protein